MTAPLVATFLLLQLLCQVFATDGSGCEPPNGYVTHPEYNASYKIHLEHVPWAEARDRCIAEGAHLAMFTSVKQIKHIVNPTRSDMYYFMHIGIHRSASTGDWVRVDNGQVAATSIPWMNISSHRFHDNDNDDCAILWHSNGMKIKGFRCDTRVPFVCERPTPEGCPSPVGPQGTGSFGWAGSECQKGEPGQRGDEGSTGDAGAPEGLQCEPPCGYVTFPEYKAAYKIYDEYLTWDGAQNWCIAEGAHLAVFTTVRKLKRIVNSSILRSQRFLYNGIHRSAATGQWVRADNGLPATSIQWQGYPDGKNCTVMLDNGYFGTGIATFDCDEEFAFVCERPTPEGCLSPVDPQGTGSPSLAGSKREKGGLRMRGKEGSTGDAGAPEGFECEPPSGYVKFPEYNASYKIHEERVPWSYARDRCIAEGAHLAVFTSVDKIEHIVNRTILESYSLMHTGIRRSVSTGDWVRVDNGLPATSIPWSGFISGEDYNCVFILKNNGVRITNWNCNSNSVFICETSTAESCPSPAGPRVTGSSCLAGSGCEKGEPGQRDIKGSTGDAGASGPQGSTESTDRFECEPPGRYVTVPKYNASYKLHPEPVPWSYARDRCIAEGAHLAVITSFEKFRHIFNHTIPESGYTIHNGIYFSPTTLDWVRVDNGLPPTSIPWSMFNPDEDYNCTTLHEEVDGRRVSNYHCVSEHTFICERPTPEGCPSPVGPRGTKSPSLAGSEREEGEPEERDENGSDKEGSTGDAGAPEGFECEPPSGYVKFPEYNASYKIHEERVPWTFARDRCIAEGAHLAVFTSVDKIVHVVNRTTLESNFFIHTGIRRSVSNGDWVRVDNGLPATSIPWSGFISGEDYNCAVIWTHHGVRITDWDCNSNLAFVCETSTAESCPSPAGPRVTESSCLAGSECEHGEPGQKDKKGSTKDAGAPDRFECEPPNGYLTVPEYNASYKIHLEHVPWDYARDRCIAEGAHLAVITSVEQINHIVDPTIMESEMFMHTGIRRLVSTGDWVRVDNGLPVTSISLSNFSSYENSNCVILFRGTIQNLGCNQDFAFVCEKSTAEGCPIPVGPQGTISPCLAGSECEIGEPGEKGVEGQTGNATALSQPGATGPTVDPVMQNHSTRAEII